MNSQETKIEQYARCSRCGLRKHLRELVNYKGQLFCKFNGSPSCYMKEVWEDMEKKHNDRKRIKS